VPPRDQRLHVWYRRHFPRVLRETSLDHVLQAHDLSTSSTNNAQSGAQCRQAGPGVSLHASGPNPQHVGDLGFAQPYDTTNKKRGLSQATSGDRYLATSGDFFMATDRQRLRWPLTWRFLVERVTKIGPLVPTGCGLRHGNWFVGIVQAYFCVKAEGRRSPAI
jgi:hypothetical protein